MSLGAELLLRAIVEAMEPAVFLSEFGDGSPLLDDVANPPVRMARRPVGGMIRRRGLAAYAPPLSIIQDRADCERLAASAPLIVDALGSDAARMIDRASRLSPSALAVLRLRGAAKTLRGAPGALRLIYKSQMGDLIFLRRDLMTDAFDTLAADLMAARVDEFDMLAGYRGGVIDRLRYGSGSSEVVLRPLTLLDQASAGQSAAALGAEKVIIAADGGCALVAPQISAAPGAVSISISGLPAHAPAPQLSLPNTPDWTIRNMRSGGEWSAVATPPESAAPVVSGFLELNAPGAEGAEVSEVAVSITRARGNWEIWDEAQSQLELEESW
ncbi:MAG: hypothetical protein AAF401_13860 [Pseudomonadota bacterium]